MLRRFNVKNFLSFSCKENGMSEEFSMIPGKVRNKNSHLYDNGTMKLLKFAAVYGANASGKSNLVKAIQCMQDIVMNGSAKGNTEKYCRMDDSNKDKPSYFEMEIILDGKCYSYGFEVVLSRASFMSEWLIELHTNGSETVIFERDIESGSCLLNIEWKEKNLRNKLEVYAGDVKSDAEVLFLFMMNQNKKGLYEEHSEVQILQNIYRWITNSLDVNYPERPISNNPSFSKEDKIAEIRDLIAAFGTGITDVSIVDAQLEEIPVSQRNDILNKIIPEIIEIRKRIAQQYSKPLDGMLQFTITARSPKNLFLVSVDSDENITCKTIKFGHGNNKALFRLGEESDGTVRLLDLLEILLSDERKTYVIDELDRCLHPSLTYKFIETFLRVAEKKDVQLIVTTHESRLMDFDLLRRDEIWFVNKRDTGESDIYSLEEYSERFDRKISKAYLDGRYGGVPIFNTIFPVGEA